MAGGIVTPIKKIHFDFHAPLSFQDAFTTEAVLHYTEAARLNIEYIIRNSAGETVTTGYTIQLMLDRDSMDLNLVAPPFYEAFLERWKRGDVE